MLYAYMEEVVRGQRDLYTLYDTEDGVYRYYKREELDFFVRNGARVLFSMPTEQCDLTGNPVVGGFAQALLDYVGGTPPVPDAGFLEDILARAKNSKGDLRRKDVEGILYSGAEGQITFYVRPIRKDNMMWDWYTTTTGLCVRVKTNRFCGNFRYEIDKKEIKNVEAYQDEKDLKWE